MFSQHQGKVIGPCVISVLTGLPKVWFVSPSLGQQPVSTVTVAKVSWNNKSALPIWCSKKAWGMMVSPTPALILLQILCCLATSLIPAPVGLFSPCYREGDLALRGSAQDRLVVCRKDFTTQPGDFQRMFIKAEDRETGRAQDTGSNRRAQMGLPWRGPS